MKIPYNNKHSEKTGIWKANIASNKEPRQLTHLLPTNNTISQSSTAQHSISDVKKKLLKETKYLVLMEPHIVEYKLPGYIPKSNYPDQYLSLSLLPGMIGQKTLSKSNLRSIAAVHVRLLHHQ